MYQTNSQWLQSGGPAGPSGRPFAQHARTRSGGGCCDPVQSRVGSAVRAAVGHNEKTPYFYD